MSDTMKFEDWRHPYRDRVSRALSKLDKLITETAKGKADKERISVLFTDFVSAKKDLERFVEETNFNLAEGYAVVMNTYEITYRQGVTDAKD